MKAYEGIAQSMIMPRIPAIIRVDGRAFHSFAKGFDYPFDRDLSRCMQAAGMALAHDIPTAAMVYGQSDEISILLVDDAKPRTQQWFSGKVQKIASIAASIATLSFNTELSRIISYNVERDADRQDLLESSLGKAMFDARVFSIPESDAANYFYWRWLDCTRNSVQMAGRAHFSHAAMHGLFTSKIKEKLRFEAQDPWEDMDPIFKDGWLISKEKGERFDKARRYDWKIGPVVEDIRQVTMNHLEIARDTREAKDETEENL